MIYLFFGSYCLVGVNLNPKLVKYPKIKKGGTRRKRFYTLQKFRMWDRAVILHNGTLNWGCALGMKGGGKLKKFVMFVMAFKKRSAE